MAMFEFDPLEHASTFQSDGYVYIPRGITQRFYEQLTMQVEEYLETHRLHNYLVGDKQQAVYQLPEGERYLAELRQTIGTVCGLDPGELVLSERHIKVYDPDANPSPLAHKDRFASQISVGISVHVPEGSTLVLYPYDHLEVNTFNSSTELRKSFAPGREPETSLNDARRVEIADGPRDVIIFRGNMTWHLRARPAGTTMVYLKLNAWNCDPLGEDMRTDAIRQMTSRLLELDDDDLGRLQPRIGRRVDYLHRRFNRNWEEVIGVVLWGQPHTSIDEQEFQVLQAVDGRRSAAAVIDVALNGAENGAGSKIIRSLAARGIIDLVPAEGTTAAATPR